MYEDPQGALFKLQQTGIVSEYLTQFERLANRIVGLPPSVLLSCFVSGLLLKLRREVQALRPLSLPQAVELARLQEDKLLDRRRGPWPPSLPPPPLVSKPLTPSASLPSKLLLKRLTTEEMALRQDQGLCYHCEEKWSHGHRCKPHLHLLIADEDPDSPADPFSLDPPSVSSQDPLLVPQISMNAMEGTLAPQTFRLRGVIRHHQVIILIDGGNTHNFI